MYGCWDDIIKPLISSRLEKPRNNGITMIIDKGLSLSQTKSLLEIAAPFFDFLKLSFGTMALYEKSLLIEKIKLVKDHGITIYPGGTFFEIAYWQGNIEQYFERLVKLNLDWIEISDGTIQLSQTERTRLIKAAISYGLNVISEVGKKDLNNQPSDEELIETANHDLSLGVAKVIIEARESGKGIGIYDNCGEINKSKFEAITSNLPLEKIIWESPLKNQQAALINNFGSNVNLGNIAPLEIMALEALRLGYRSDTWNPIE